VEKAGFADPASYKKAQHKQGRSAMATSSLATPNQKNNGFSLENGYATSNGYAADRTDSTRTQDAPSQDAPTTFANYFVEIETVGKKDIVKKIPLNAPTIRDNLANHTGDWPRRVGPALFARDGDLGPLWLTQTPQLFAWLQSQFSVPGNPTNMVEWSDRGTGFLPRGQFDAYLRQTATSYVAVESAPHEPRFEGHYYIHPELPKSDGSTLEGLLRRFAPATEHDRHLILAMLLTFVWGGHYGQRPGFILSGAEGDVEMNRGIGKTTLVGMCAKPFGGTFDIRKDDKWDNVLKRLLSDTASSTQRVILVDNVKSARFSSADLEGLITSERINGYKNYVGDGARPNTFTVCITMNGASLSKDLAQRCVPILLKRPQYSGNWKDDTTAYIEAHRWVLVADLVNILRQPAKHLECFRRWGAWERDVLGRLPDPEALQKLIEKRRDDIDDDTEEADIIRAGIADELRARGHGDPDDCGVRIPAAIMAEIVSKALNERLSTTACGTKLKAMDGAIPELRKTKYCGNKLWIWTGMKHTGSTEQIGDRPVGGHRW
jgi:hypothetical protein